MDKWGQHWHDLINYFYGRRRPRFFWFDLFQGQNQLENRIRPFLYFLHKFFHGFILKLNLHSLVLLLKVVLIQRLIQILELFDAHCHWIEGRVGLHDWQKSFDIILDAVDLWILLGHRELLILSLQIISLPLQLNVLLVNLTGTLLHLNTVTALLPVRIEYVILSLSEAVLLSLSVLCLVMQSVNYFFWLHLSIFVAFFKCVVTTLPVLNRLLKLLNL